MSYMQVLSLHFGLFFFYLSTYTCKRTSTLLRFILQFLSVLYVSYHPVLAHPSQNSVLRPRRRAKIGNYFNAHLFFVSNALLPAKAKHRDYDQNLCNTFVFTNYVIVEL